MSDETERPNSMPGPPLPWYLAAFAHAWPHMSRYPFVWLALAVFLIVFGGSVVALLYNTFLMPQKDAYIHYLEKTGPDGKASNGASDTISPSTGAQSMPILLPPKSNNEETNFISAKVLETLHQKFGLRQLQELESDKAFNKMPRGTFGYIYASNLRDCFEKKEFQYSARVSCFQSPNNSDFEIQRLEDNQFQLVAFVSDTDEATISAAPDGTTHQVLLSTVPFKAVNKLILIPFERLLKIDPRDIPSSQTDYLSIKVVDAMVR